MRHSQVTQTVRRLLMKPKLLDTFCKAGGAGYGYSLAGFDVVGIDIQPQPHYPFPFILGDALDILRRMIAGETFLASDGKRYGLKDFSAIHASPPCQAYSSATKNPEKHPDLYKPTISILQKSGLPYVCENVIGAPYNHGIFLCGSMFNLSHDGEWLQRHRNFETSFMLFQPQCQHHKKRPITVTGKSFVKEVREYEHSRQAPFALAEKLMGINWMTHNELANAIPPAYTHWLGLQVVTRLTPREPDSLKAAVLILPGVVKVESNLPT